jgi:hypothetical protein
MILSLNFALFILNLEVGWEISKLQGQDIYVTIENKTFRLSSSEAIPSQISDFYVKTGRKSRVFLQKQSKFKPSSYRRLILDEESSAFFSVSLTFFYGKLLVDFSELEDTKQEKQLIEFYDEIPYYAELSGGKLIIISLDKGYLLYCIKCEGNIWRLEEKKNKEENKEEKYENTLGKSQSLGNSEVKRESAFVEREFVSRKIFLISKDKIEDAFVDDELFSLFEDLEKRMKRGKFAKDIIYSESYEVPEPISPKSKKLKEFSKEDTDIHQFRHFIMIELRCLELKKQGRECKLK